MCFISLEPWFIWGINISYILAPLLILFLIINIIINKRYSVYQLMPILLLIYFVFFVYKSVYNMIWVYNIFLIFMIYFINIRKEYYIRIYKALEKLFGVILGIGIPFYLINLVYELPNHEYMSRNVGLVPYYNNYLIFVVPGGLNAIASFSAFRYHSVFDEAGVVGTISLLMLAGNKFVFNNWYQKSILFAGILSFSFFFYLGFILIYLINFKSIFNVRKFSIIAIITLIGFNYLKENDVFEKTILTRFLIEDGKFVGDTRVSVSWEIMYDNFIKNGDIIFGEAATYYAGKNETIFGNDLGASYKMYVYLFGIFGVSFMLYIYVSGMWRITNKNYKDTIYMLFVLLISFYQRPWLLSIYYPVILFASAGNIKKRNNDLVL